MAMSMDTMQKRSFDSPDKTLPAGTGEARIVRVGDLGLMYMTLPPGWRWSNDLKPIQKTDSCQAPHLNYFLTGRFHIRMDDGTEADFGPGDIAVIPPGHDGWVVGDEPVTAIDITGGSVWAKTSQQDAS